MGVTLLMKHLAKTLPVLFASMGYAQSSFDADNKKIDFGFTSSTFAGASVNYFAPSFLEKQNLYSYLPLSKPNAIFSNYGWKQGFFIWVNLNQHFAYKAQADITFCVNNFKQLAENSFKNNYCRSFGIEFKPQLVIRFGTYDPEPIFKMARDMSYYVTGRQSYLILGPKFSYSKPDRTFLQETNLKYSAVGAVVGIGTDNIFPNLNFAPELLLSIEYKTRNSQGGSSPLTRYYVSLSLAANFF
jgi:hypothetical protein